MNNQNKPNKPKEKINQDRFPKVLLIWGLIITAIITLWVNQPKQSANLKKWTIAQTLEAAERGEIENGFIESDSSGGNSWYILSGTLKNTAIAEQPEVMTEEGMALAKGNPANQVVRFHAQGRLTEDDYKSLRSILTEKRAST